jgi:circadian clock protein KaiC
MRSIGIELQPYCDRKLLQFHAARPTVYGLEMHLAQIHRCVEEFQPDLIVLDPISNFLMAGTNHQVKGMLLRLIDYLKSRGITGIFTSLTGGGEAVEQSEAGVSSLIDTWLLLRFLESDGERNRALYILKSRGMPHSNQIREFVLTGSGIELVDVFLGPQGVLTGTARYVQEARERAQALERRHELEVQERELERQRLTLERQIAELRGAFEERAEQVRSYRSRSAEREETALADREEIGRRRRLPAAGRGADANGGAPAPDGGANEVNQE